MRMYRSFFVAVSPEPVDAYYFVIVHLLKNLWTGLQDKHDYLCPVHPCINPVLQQYLSFAII